MQVKSESGLDPVLPSHNLHAPVIQVEAASLPVASLLPVAVIVPVIVADVIVDSAETFVTSLPQILKDRDFERLVSGIQTFAHNEAVLCAALCQLTDFLNKLSNVDLNKLSNTGDPTFINILVALMQGNPQSVQIQKSGLTILTYMCCSLGAAFPSHLTIPVATISLQNMAAHPKNMYLQRIACASLNNLSKQVHNDAILDTICNAGGFDLVELVLAFSRTVCLTLQQAPSFGLLGDHFVKNLVPSGGGNDNSEGTLCFIYQLLFRFAGNWTASPHVVAGQQGGIEDGIIRTMRAYPNFATVQERGCVALGRLANRNIAQFNQSNMQCISTVLQILQTTTVTNQAQAVACRTLQRFIGVENITMAATANINKKMQSNMGDTGVIPLLLRGIKYHYDLNNSKTDMLDYIQSYVNLLVALVVENADNCRRVFNADGVTLLVALVVSRRQKNISQLETSCVQALCYIFIYAKGLHADVYRNMLLSAGVAKSCPTTNSSNKKKGISSAIDAVITTASKSALPGVVLEACLRMLGVCAEVPGNQDSVGVPGKTLALKILKPNQRVVQKNVSVNAGAMHLLATLTEQGAFTNEADVKLIASLTLFAPESNHQPYKDAFAKLRNNIMRSRLNGPQSAST